MHAEVDVMRCDQACGEASGSCRYEGIAVAIALKTSFTFTPAAVTAAIAIRAINATRSAYSSRSCPSSRRSELTTETRYAISSSLCTTRLRHAVLGRTQPAYHTRVPVTKK